jgi:hypothetical protein
LHEANDLWPLEPIRIYATKQEIDEYHDRFGTIRITEIGESKEMMEMVKNTYLTNRDHFSMGIERMHLDPEFGTSNIHSTAMLIILNTI